MPRTTKITRTLNELEERTPRSSLGARLKAEARARVSRTILSGVPNDNNPNLVVPIGDGFGFVIYPK